MSSRRAAAIRPDVIGEELDGKVILLNMATEQYFTLDEIGSRIWNLLKDGLTLDEVTAHMLQEFDVDADRLRADIDRLVLELEAVELIAFPEE